MHSKEFYKSLASNKGKPGKTPQEGVWGRVLAVPFFPVPYREGRTMRIRTIKPEFWTDAKIGKISRDARLLFIGLWSVCDDYGVCQSNFEFLKGQLFSYDKISSKKFQKWISELLSQNLILPFEANGDKYFYIKHFKKHQVINKPSKFRNPEPPTLPEQSRNNHGLISQGGVMVMEGKGRVMEVEGECEGEPGQEEVKPSFLSLKEIQEQNPNPIVKNLAAIKSMSTADIDERKRRLREQAKQLEEQEC
jgi:hypothetical protein